MLSNMEGQYKTSFGLPIHCFYAKNHASFIASANKNNLILLLSSGKYDIAAMEFYEDGEVTAKWGRPIEKIIEPFRTYARNIDSGK